MSLQDILHLGVSYDSFNIIQPYDVEVGGVGHVRNALWAGSIEAGILY